MMLLKVHHTLTDGYGVASFMANVMDEFDEKNLPHLPELKWWQRILMYFSIPYNLYWIFMRYNFYPADVNPLTTKHPHNSGVKRGFFAKEYMVADVKTKAKEMKVSVNDFLMTVLSMTMKEYFISKGDEKSSRILMYVPYSIRQKEADPQNFDFTNQFAIFPVILDLVNDF
jgi:hypothetical protein